jgi:16S rRNA (guanine527-N7)-methyltransferase
MELLKRLALQLGEPLDAAQLAAFSRYGQLVLRWNQRVNLTSITDWDELQTRLFADSLALAPFVRRACAEAADPCRLIDIGTGAGIPGIPLKLALPRLEVVLVEATGKKVAFLERAIRELGLGGLTVVHARAEALAHDPCYRSAFDVVTARAVAPLPTLLELCLPFCRPGGWGIFPKGTNVESELTRASRALDLLGAQLVEVVPVPIEELHGTTVVVVRQEWPVPPTYPRRPGIPAKRPL